MLLAGSLELKLLTSNKETKKVFNGRIVKRIRIKSGFLKAVENAERKLISFDNSTLVKNRRDNMIKLRQVGVINLSNFGLLHVLKFFNTFSLGEKYFLIGIHLARLKNILTKKSNRLS